MEPFLLLTLFAIYEGGRSYLGELAVNGLLNGTKRFREQKQKLTAFSTAYDTALTALTNSPQLEMGDGASIKRLLQASRTDSNTVAPSDTQTVQKLVNGVQDNFYLPLVQLNVHPLVKLSRHVAKWHNLKLPNDLALEIGFTIFIDNMQQQLFASSLFQEEMLAYQQFYSQRGTPADSARLYLRQFISYHQDLDFVGIPELKDRNAIRLQDIFVQLQAEPEPQPISERRLGFGDPDSEDLQRLGARDLRPTVAKPKVSVNEALRQAQKLLVLGDPGAGKTTLLKYIALAFARHEAHDCLALGERRLPIFVRLSDFARERAERQADYDLIDYLHTAAKERLGVRHLPSNFFTIALSDRRCCVCLDGLDELGDSALRRDMVRIVTNFANRYAGNRFVLSSRLVGYEEAPLSRQQFSHFTVRPFEEPQIRNFVTQWYLAREKDPVLRAERTQHLIDTILAEEPIQRLATNPLLLTIIALVHRIEAELPHERVALYRKCVATLADKWEKQKGIKVDLNQPHQKYKQRLLEQLAYWMHTQPGEVGRAREIKEGTLRQQIAHFLLTNRRLSLDEETAWQEAEAFVQVAKSRTGLLVERGDKLYSFAHLTFQEYLTAMDIQKRTLFKGEAAIWEEMKERLHDPHWREVILLLMGSLNAYDELPSLLIQRILAQTDQYEPVLPRHLFLAARILADRVEVDAPLENQIIERLFNLLNANALSSNDALSSLGRQGQSPLAAQLLLQLAQDNTVDTWVRSNAAQALGQLGHADSAAQLLLQIAQNNTVHDFVRLAAAQALGQLGHTDSATQLLLQIAQDNNVEAFVRRAAAQASGQLGHTDSALLSGLLQLAQDNNVHDGVRSAAAQALGQLGHTDSAAQLLLQLAQDNNVYASVRSDAAHALGQLGHTDSALLSGLLQLAQDNNVDDEVRSAAAQALGQLGHTDSAAQLLLQFAQDNNVYASVRSAAAQALGQLGHTDSAAQLLLQLAQDNNVYASVRSAAAQALGQLGHTDSAAQLLLQLAQDNNVYARVRSEAAQALGQLGHTDSAAQLLLQLAQDHTVHDGVRSAAAEALGQLGHTDSAAQLLLQIAQDNNVDTLVRSAAAQALGQLGHTDSALLSGLLQLAQDNIVHALVRRNAYESLKTLLQVSV